jgi:hypothetical protein
MCALFWTIMMRIILFWIWYITVKITRCLDFVYHIVFQAKYNVTDIVSVSFLILKDLETPVQLGPLERTNLNH